MHLRVLTLNVWNTNGDARRIELINGELRRLAPDLVAFQEVVSRPDNNQLDKLLAGTGLHGTHQSQVLASDMPWVDQYGGSALASRWPHKIVEVLDLRLAGVMDIPWCTLAATIPLPEEGDVLFIATTASWRPSTETARERQAIAITDLDARHRTSLPTIIAGDFNASPDAASIRYLSGLQSLDGRSVYYHDVWSAAGTGPGYTWTTDNPNGKSEIEKVVRQPVYHSRLDHIFVGSWDAHPKAHAYIRHAALAFDQPLDGIWISDHFGVLVDLEIGKNEK